MVTLAGTGMFCGWRRAAVPGRCWLSSGTFVSCGSWRPCCRPCLTSCSRPMSWWPWTQQASSLVSSQEDGSCWGGAMRLGEGCVCPLDGGRCCKGTGKPQCGAAGTSVAERSAVAECRGGCFVPKVNFQVCKEGCWVRSRDMCKVTLVHCPSLVRWQRWGWSCPGAAELCPWREQSEGIHREMPSTQRPELAGFS